MQFFEIQITFGNAKKKAYIDCESISYVRMKAEDIFSRSFAEFENSKVKTRLTGQTDDSIVLSVGGIYNKDGGITAREKSICELVEIVKQAKEPNVKKEIGDLLAKHGISHPVFKKTQENKMQFYRLTLEYDSEYVEKYIAAEDIDEARSKAEDVFHDLFEDEIDGEVDFNLKDHTGEECTMSGTDDSVNHASIEIQT